MSSLPSISHRLFVAAVGHPKTESEKNARRDRAMDAGDRSVPPGCIFPAPKDSTPQPDIAMQQWLRPPANSGI
jgi:hypothetical protein